MRTDIKQDCVSELRVGFGHTRDKPELGIKQAQQMHDERIDILYEISKKVEAESELSRLLDEIMGKTRHTLKAAASSVLLVDRQTGELFFETANGKAGNALTAMKVKVDSGIAHWVVHHNQPLIVNDVSQDTRFNKTIDKSTGFITMSILCVPLMVGRKVIGALEVLNKLDGNGFSDQDMELLTPLASFAALAIDNAQLNRSILDGYINTVKVLAATIDAKDPYTYGHSQRVTEYALLGATSLSLPSEELKVIEHAGILHDIGKIAVSDSILCKPAPLTPDEWQIIRTHPRAGAEIISNVPFLEEARNLILDHHERYDGTGYPNKLHCDDIPVGARLLAVADAFDTMTTDRAYRAALSIDYAIEELRRCAGKQFCPDAVEAFIAGLHSTKGLP